MYYTQEEKQTFRVKDKRISWLSIFSSLCQKNPQRDVKEIENEAYRLNEELYKKYPYPIMDVSEPKKPIQKSAKRPPELELKDVPF